MEAAERLDREGIPFKLIREPDAPYFGAATALGVCPVPRERVRRLFAKFPLLR